MLSKHRHLLRRLQSIHIENEVKGKKYGHVVDVGGGKGVYRRLINCDSYTLTDIEDRVGDGSVVIADANVHLPFDDSSVDLILCTEVLEHLHTPKVAMREMRRILKSDGTLLITVPFVWGEHEVPHDYYRYTQFGIKHLCEDAGFADFIIKNTNGFWYTWIALLVSRMRSPVFIPIVFILNGIARVVEKIESPGVFPLSVHAVIRG